MKHLPRLALAFSLLLQLHSLSLAATRVDLVIDEPMANRTVPWPITTGVPFPRGALTTPDNCRLVDDTGAEQLLQAKVAATWDAERTSIRWLTIDFIAQPGRKYALEFGEGLNRKRMESPLVIAGDPPKVTTGSLAVEFSQTGPAALGTISIASNNAFASGGRDGDHVYIDQDGRRFTSAGDGKDRQIVVESTGPVRACVRVDGYYTGPKGERIVKYRTRYHFFAGLGLIKAVDEFRIVGSTKDTRFKDIALVLDLAGKTDGRTIAVDASGQAGNQIVTQPWEAATRSIASYQQTYRHYGNPEYHAAFDEISTQGQRTLAQPDRMGEWMQVTDAGATITGCLRWFWQQFPKEWETTPNQLVIHLWSPRAGEFDFGPTGVRKFLGPAGEKYLLNWNGVKGSLSPITNFFFFAGRAALERGDADGLGTNKHHEVFWHFAPAGQSSLGAEYGRLAAEQPIALASGAWNCGTDVFGPLAPRPNDSPYEAIVDRLFDLSRYAQRAFGDYGWWVFGSGPHYSYQWDAEAGRHYADPRRFEYHTYQKETQFWWCYLRSGERKFYDWAIPAENHWVDIAVSHAPTTFHSEWRGGEPATRRLEWPEGDWSIDSPLHYVRHHDTGEAWLRGASQYWGSYHRTLETTSLAYYLTGDERFNDVIEYWQRYWGDLAGKTSASDNLRPWHREQAWYRPTATGEKSKTWAQMIRDYAPFGSGTRHQQTLFFNLATLYEHTWDPQIGQALKEYADAFLDPAHRMGVWRSQDNNLPSNSDSPMMSHYWSSALWKYARATRDPRMPDILRRYYTTMYAADPYNEDVGVYSNQQIAYAWYFTHDPRHLQPAQAELEHLLPNSLPLDKPESLGERIYNPHHMIRSMAGTQRLIWALDDAKKQGVAVPPTPPLRPQRTPIAIVKKAGVALEATLWGYDRNPTIIGPNGQPFPAAKLETEQYSSHLQPFDRTLPKFEVYLHRLTVPADAPSGSYLLVPKLELGIVALNGADGLLCSAREPIAIYPGDQWFVQVFSAQQGLKLTSAAAGSLRVIGPDGGERVAKVLLNSAMIPLTADDAGKVFRIENSGRTPTWFQLDEPFNSQSLAVGKDLLVKQFASANLLPSPFAQEPRNSDSNSVPGRFGQALTITPTQPFRIADHLAKDGQQVRLFDERQGTIEFWIRRQWDDRLTKLPPRWPQISNGLLQIAIPWKLPLDEWAHVAVVWRPFKHAPERTCIHYYVNGLDEANYRNVKWEGYGDVPPGFAAKGKWLESFVIQAAPGTAYMIDDLRISSTPRYTDLKVDFGGQQTFNPVRFDPPTEPVALDESTEMLLRFDGDLQAQLGRGRGTLTGRLGGSK